LLIFLARSARLDQRIISVVDIGVGGSDLGPVTLYRALRRYADGASLQWGPLPSFLSKALT
jgi:glucose-6-phosphate isomerase